MAGKLWLIVSTFKQTTRISSFRCC